jgi:hypothetical protein
LRLVIVESTAGSKDELTWWIALQAPGPKPSVYCMYGTRTCFAADEVSTTRVKNAGMRVVLPFVGTATRGDLGAEPSLHASSGAACRVSIAGKGDDEMFRFDHEITTFKRVELKCEYGGD